ncbi:hypothetical protein [Oceanipulchritudo coccoides]|nr:hypothetical protein [Oceanipulchritudo coccoides]
MSTVVGLYGLAESLFKSAGKAAAQAFSRSRAPFAARGDYIVPRHPVSTDVALVNARSAGDAARRSSLGSEAVVDAVQYGGTAAGLLWALDSPGWLNDAFTELDTAFGMTDLNLKTFQRQQANLQNEYDENCPPSN